MKLLITGGAGFIGSAVIRHIIVNTTDSVVNVDKITYAGNLKSLAEVAGSPLRPQFLLLGQQGELGPSGSRLAAHLRPA